MLRIRAIPKTRLEATSTSSTTQVPNYMYSPGSTNTKQKMGENYVQNNYQRVIHAKELLQTKHINYTITTIRLFTNISH